MACKKLGVSELLDYQEVKTELGADIAIVTKDQEISGEDFLNLTEANIVKLFSMGQRKKVLRLIKSKCAITTDHEVGIYSASAIYLLAKKPHKVNK